MQYLVKTGGEVKELQGRTYVISAPSEEEACAIAEAKFAEKYSAVNVSCDKANNRTFRAIIALVCIVAAELLLSMVQWTDGHKQYELYPHLFSTLFAIGFYVAFLFKYKGLDRIAEQRIVDWALDISSIALLASFLEIFIVDKHIPVLSFLGKELLGFDVKTEYIIALAVIMSWIGVKLVSVVCIGVAGFFAIGQFLAINNAMHIWGFVYAILAFVGIALYATVEPAFIEASPAFSKWLLHGVGYLKNDVKGAMRSVNNIQDSVVDKVNAIKENNIGKLKEKKDD